MKITHDSLGISRMINGSTTYTRIGGSLMSRNVVEAMARGAESFTDMSKLMDAACKRIATRTGNEAAYITPGCAAGLALSFMALKSLDLTGKRNEVLMDCVHRIPYESAITFSGSTIKQYGRTGKRSPADLKSAINEKTLAIFWVAGSIVSDEALDIFETVMIANEFGIPVIVDAAAQLPPVSNLSFFTVEAGASAVVFSGGKAIRGPQSSGLVLGKQEILAAASLLAAPYDGPARVFKVGKEEIFGLTQAIEDYLDTDHLAEHARLYKECEKIVALLKESEKVSGQITPLNEAGQPVPRVELAFSDKFSSDTPMKVHELLLKSETPIALELKGSLFISPDMFQDGELEIVVKALINVISLL